MLWSYVLMQMVCILQDKLHSIPTVALRLVLLFYMYSAKFPGYGSYKLISVPVLHKTFGSAGAC